MAETGERIRVTLRWVQILDKLEPFWKEEGEFRFTALVEADGATTRTRIPEKGFYKISDHPAWNRQSLDKVIFEGPVKDRLVVELRGEELDFLSDDDQLAVYRREFTGSPSSWLGRHCPGDEGSADPENLANWRVCYEIERS